MLLFKQFSFVQMVPHLAGQTKIVSAPVCLGASKRSEDVA